MIGRLKARAGDAAVLPLFFVGHLDVGRASPAREQRRRRGSAILVRKDVAVAQYPGAVDAQILRVQDERQDPSIIPTVSARSHSAGACEITTESGAGDATSFGVGAAGRPGPVRRSKRGDLVTACLEAREAASCTPGDRPCRTPAPSSFTSPSTAMSSAVAAGNCESSTVSETTASPAFGHHDRCRREWWCRHAGGQRNGEERSEAWRNPNVVWNGFEAVAQPLR